jgi:23S rRNA pseudouridine1911/1915/1917 synthase
MRDVPFYPNREDAMSCMLANYRMVIQYFLHKEWTWEQLEDLTGYTTGRPAWTVKALTSTAKELGLSVRMIEPFNYIRFAKEGKDYLYDLYDNEEVEWYLQHTNILEIKPSITSFLATVRPECRQAKLSDIDDMLAEGRLVFLTLNGRALNDATGYVNHSVLVIDKAGDDYIIHDPGLPPRPNRHVPAAKLWLAMGGESNTSEVTGFMLRTAGLRLDQYVIREKPTLSRAYATRLIIDGRVLVNGKTNKPGYKLRQNDDISIDYNEADEPDVPDIDLPILYEDDDCLVINKPAGVLTHNKGVRHVEATVASFMKQRSDLLAGERPGIVHRLDRATSGVIICAKTPQALSWLQKQFHDRHAKKTYTAAIAGTLDPAEAIIDMPIERNPKAPATFRVGPNGKSAQTAYKVAASSGAHSLVELRPKTGRTHQLRVHLAYQRHPIVGDTLYDGEPAERLYLHAYQLEITIPNGQTMTFTAPIPPAFDNLLARDNG